MVFYILLEIQEALHCNAALYIYAVLLSFSQTIHKVKSSWADS